MTFHIQSTTASPRTVSRRLCASLTAAIILSAGLIGRAQRPTTATGVMVTAAPVFILPDATRPPLATLPAGTTVRVLGRERDWYKIMFRDPRWGERTGYVLAANIRIDPNVPVSPPGGARAPIPGIPQYETPVTHVPTTLTPKRPSQRGYMSVNGTSQTTSPAFTGTTTFRQNVETASVLTSYAGGHPLVLDIAGSQPVWHHLGVALAVTWSRQTKDGSVSASIPHPFYFNAPRTVSGTAADLLRQELAIHLDPSFVVPLGRTAQLALFGGPSYFRVKAGLVTAVTANEAYPYDTATFADATTVEGSRSHVGYNAGVDLMVVVSKYVGVGAIGRYSRSMVPFPTDAGDEVKVKAGGLQVGGGLRFRF